ncbi:MAG: Rieske 2Fe-2S domain-containing protein [Betaproteobacteria bacterium]|nr:Rieske 2Fe-2S domain-containing protein [Betaproteobacteria bacterium]
MAWIKLCASGEIAEGSATVLSADDVAMLVIRRRGQCLAVAPLCAHMEAALTEGVFAECLEGNAPKCNRHLTRARAEGGECPGTARSPILQYETKEVAGALYADPARQRLSDLQYLSCSPVAEAERSASLRINLWGNEQGESVESISGRARPVAETRKR